MTQKEEEIRRKLAEAAVDKDEAVEELGRDWAKFVEDSEAANVEAAQELHARLE